MPEKRTASEEHLIGVISDTHGLIRPEALDTLRHTRMIVHAGDVGAPEVLAALRNIAPVVAVRGNMDSGGWALKLPRREVVEIGSVLIYLVHDLYDLDLDPASAGISAVISGHSHRPSMKKRDGVLFINPGSAGPRRFSLPVSVALLKIKGSSLSAEIHSLSV